MERFCETKEWVNYLVNSRFENVYTDHSFDFKGQYIPLLQSGDEFYSPGFEDDKYLLAEIKDKAQKLGIKRIQVDSDIKSYLNISGYTCILDLTKKVNPTKGCKSIVKTSQKNLICTECTDVEKFKLDYFKIAGKKTRPDKTFELLNQWIQQGNGLLLKAHTNESVTAGYVYILFTKTWSYYFMGCSEYEYKKYGISNFLIWNAIEKLKSIGIQCLEMGEQFQNCLRYCPTEKEKNIALFKRSFGGQIVASPASEYFFCSETFKETMNKRILEYIESEFN